MIKFSLSKKTTTNAYLSKQEKLAREKKWSEYVIMSMQPINIYKYKKSIILHKSKAISKLTSGNCKSVYLPSIRA